MALATVSQVNFSGSGSTVAVTYFSEDITAVLAQTGAVSIQPVNVLVMDTIDEVEGGSSDAQCTAMIAVNSNGLQLNAPGNYMALPCPTYCKTRGSGIPS
ncbi:MAG: hypothetical protein ACOYNO_02585 [Saprospiraceae bacterium]|jgi:hypothetical protein